MEFKENFPLPNRNKEIIPPAKFKENNHDQPESSPVFQEGEIFDAEKELVNLKQYHGQAGLDKLKIYQEKLNFKKQGLASMEVKLFDLINKNPAAQADDLTNLISADIKKYALTEAEKNRFYSILDAYQKKHQPIEKIRQEYADEQGRLDGRAMYKRFFDKDPEGDVKVVIRPMTISFCPNNFDDYAYLVNEAYLDRRDINDDDKTIARTLGGGSLGKSLVDGFDNILTVESPNYFNSQKSINNVADHEEQHVYNRLKADIYNIEVDELLRKINKIEADTGQEIPKNLLNFMIRNSEIEFRIKDELSAYFKDNSTTKRTSKAILGKDTIYRYSYRYNKHDRAIPKNPEFDPHYVRIVEEAIIAFVDLMKSGYNQDQAQSFLFNEPLATWPRSVARLIKLNKKPEDKNKDKEKYISKLVNK